MPRKAAGNRLFALATSLSVKGCWALMFLMRATENGDSTAMPVQPSKREV